MSVYHWIAIIGLLFYAAWMLADWIGVGLMVLVFAWAVARWAAYRRGYRAGLEAAGIDYLRGYHDGVGLHGVSKRKTGEGEA